MSRSTSPKRWPEDDRLTNRAYRFSRRNPVAVVGPIGHNYNRRVPLAPVEALRAWLRLFVDHIATKQVMAPALASMVGGPSEPYAESGAQVKTALALLVDRAVASGAICLDIDPLDLLRALAGVAGMSSVPGWEKSAKRLVDILIAGVRTPPAD